MRNGHGISIVSSEPRMYCGQWKDDVKHGTGVDYFKDLCSYRGIFVEGNRNGKGKFISLDRKFGYTGVFLQKSPDSQIIDDLVGVCVFSKQSPIKKKYIGCIKNGK